ncbi:hypothetical protein HSRCO_2667 [Halanaeroarchaeum sp. HSR-CO]|nr:hypothetical protein HSRCO_2667 [Halanaeroarchaeum sp. HSR-CO]
MLSSFSALILTFWTETVWARSLVLVSWACFSGTLPSAAHGYRVSQTETTTEDATASPGATITVDLQTAEQDSV